MSDDAVLICKNCGAQHELIGEGRIQSDGWMRCACGGSSFSIRKRVPIVKTEPAK